MYLSDTTAVYAGHNHLSINVPQDPFSTQFSHRPFSQPKLSLNLCVAHNSSIPHFQCVTHSGGINKPASRKPTTSHFLKLCLCFLLYASPGSKSSQRRVL